jgi:hypothetical protein
MSSFFYLFLVPSRNILFINEIGLIGPPDTGKRRRFLSHIHHLMTPEQVSIPRLWKSAHRGRAPRHQLGDWDCYAVESTLIGHGSAMLVIGSGAGWTNTDLIEFPESRSRSLGRHFLRRAYQIQRRCRRSVIWLGWATRLARAFRTAPGRRGCRGHHRLPPR